MLLEPIYAENVIVAVVCNKVWEWYVTEKDLWFLDYIKLEKAYIDKGFDIEDIINDNERKGIEVLDSQTVDIFLYRIKEYQTTKEELNNLLKNKAKNKSEIDDLLDFSPTIFVDFDNKRFYSTFPEPASFEDYVPEGWIGEYFDFTNLLPDEEKYWIDDLNENIFLKY
jgi:hypothetical protein